jgi:methyl-accepting chemotaxis protein
MEEIAKLRALGIKALVGVCWLGVLITLIGSFFATTGFLPVLLAVAIAIVPTMMAMAGRSDSTARIIIGGTLPMIPAILLYQWSGTAWLIDIHMIFFAVLAMTPVMVDWRAILASTTVTALHHLVLNFVAPSLVFNGGGNLERVIMHAVVVIAETVVLVALSNKLESGMIEQERAQVEKERFAAIAATERDHAEAEQRAVVEEIGKGLRALAAGTLSHRIVATFPPAFAELRENFNQTVGDLGAMVGQVSTASRHIQSGSNEIRSASDDLARRTEQQASSVESASSTMSRLVQAAHETAANAATVNHALGVAQDSATAGQDVVNRAMATMDLVEKSANEIRNIISLIDGIAFQTNLLALNAGVEAARAGDSGKGFAVVANEVRALAQRSADAANGIKALIDTSTTQVAEGVVQVMQTGEALKGIMAQVMEISMAVDGITLAAQENAKDLARVNETFGSLDSSTQQNAAMVEESNAALRALSNETNALMGAVSRFDQNGSGQKGQYHQAYAA